MRLIEFQRLLVSLKDQIVVGFMCLIHPLETIVKRFYEWLKRTEKPNTSEDLQSNWPTLRYDDPNHKT